MKTIRKSIEYKRKLNEILKTNMKLTQNIMDEDYRGMQLYTILLRLQIEEGLEIIRNSNKHNDD